MPSVSVIVPVYNAAQWIDKCIDSILSQTFSDFELILVNDGSSDESDIICDRYASKDNRIQVIHKPNGGSSAARATGVSRACGEFIFFADADDSLHPQCLEYLLDAIVQNPVDIVICNMPKGKCGELDLNLYRESCIDRSIYPAPWGKLYRKPLFSESTFNIGRDVVVGEDMLMNIRCAFKAKKNVWLIDRHLYNYNDHPQNTMHSFKRTPEYEARFIDLVLHSIPDEVRDRRYLRAINRYAYQIIEEVFGDHIIIRDRKKWVSSKFYKQTLDNILRYGNPTTRLGYAKIQHTAPLLRFFLLFPAKIKKMLTATK